MLAPNIDGITPDHIASLVAEKVAERRTLEYKEKLPGGTDDERKEFLSDVCSFANLNGGDILYGVRDERGADGRATGVPESIVGLASANPSSERDRLESMVRDGIKPRIPIVQTKDFQVPGRGSVLLLRIGRSWIRPHMVTFKGTSRFYSRHSTGKFQLDVQEIGRAFAEQRSLGEQLRSWRNERVARLLADEVPVRLDGPSKLLVHFVPASALAGQNVASSWRVQDKAAYLVKPSSLSTSVTWRYNADGFLVYSRKGIEECASYVQVFRNGCLEYGDGYILNVGKDRGRPGTIPSKAFEEKLVNVFGNAVVLLNQFGVEDPVYLSCVLIGVRDSGLSRDGVSFFDDDVLHKFDREVIQSPELEIDRGEPAPYRNSLLPMVNSIWQANGYEETPWLANWGLDR